MLTQDAPVYYTCPKYTYPKEEIRLMPQDILFSFVGNRDPYVENSDNEFGPVLSLLEVETFSRVYLICTGSAYFERARTVEKIAQEETENRTGCDKTTIARLVIPLAVQIRKTQLARCERTGSACGE